MATINGKLNGQANGGTQENGPMPLATAMATLDLPGATKQSLALARKAHQAAVTESTKFQLTGLVEQLDGLVRIRSIDAGIADPHIEEALNAVKDTAQLAQDERGFLEFLTRHGMSEDATINSLNLAMTVWGPDAIRASWHSAVAASQIEEKTGISMEETLRLHVKTIMEEAEAKLGKGDALKTIAFVGMLESIEKLMKIHEEMGQKEGLTRAMVEDEIRRRAKETFKEIIGDDLSKYVDARTRKDKSAVLKILTKACAKRHLQPDILGAVEAIGLPEETMQEVCRVICASSNPSLGAAACKKALGIGFGVESAHYGTYAVLNYTYYAKKILEITVSAGYGQEVTPITGEIVSRLNALNLCIGIENALEGVSKEKISDAVAIVKKISKIEAESRVALASVIANEGPQGMRFELLPKEAKEIVYSVDESGLDNAERFALATAITNYAAILKGAREKTFDQAGDALKRAKEFGFTESALYYGGLALVFHGEENVRRMLKIGIGNYYLIGAGDALNKYGQGYLQRLKDVGLADFQIAEPAYYGTVDEARKKFSPMVVSLAEELKVPEVFFYRACETINSSCDEGKDAMKFEKAKEILATIPKDMICGGLSLLQNKGVDGLEKIAPVLSYELKFRPPTFPARYIKDPRFKSTAQAALEHIQETGEFDENGRYMTNQDLIAIMKVYDAAQAMYMKKMSEKAPRRVYIDDFKKWPATRLKSLCIGLIEEHGTGNKKFLSSVQLLDRIESALAAEYMALLRGMAGEEAAKIRYPKGSREYILELKRNAIEKNPANETEIEMAEPERRIKTISFLIESIDKRLYEEDISHIVETSGKTIAMGEYAERLRLGFFKADFKVMPYVSRENCFYLVAHPSEKEMKLLIDAGKIPENGHMEGAIAYARVMKMGDALVVTNLQSDVFEKGTMDASVRKKYDDWPKMLLLAVEDLALKTGCSKVMVTCPCYQLVKWNKLRPETAYRIYAEAEDELGYGLETGPAIILEDTVTNIFWVKGKAAMKAELASINMETNAPVSIMEKLRQARLRIGAMS